MNTKLPWNVGGKPFRILGGELGNSAASHPQTMEPVWERLAALGLNTVLVPLGWDQWEPVEGRFDTAHVDALLAGAERHGLKLALLWFGAWKNSMSCYVPPWVKRDSGRFPRARTRTGRAVEILSAFSASNLDADRRAFTALMSHLAQTDKKATVLMVQVENEIGFLPDAREGGAADAVFAQAVPAELLAGLHDRHATLEPELLALRAAAGDRRSGTWAEVFGAADAAEEVFQAWHYARYVEALAAAGKAEHDMPLFVNAALNRSHQRPGEYPSAGPLPHLIDVWKIGAPSIDLLSPDLYWGDFEQWCGRFDRADNPLFIPECGPGPANAAQAFAVFGRHGALGFCPFAIDSYAEADAEALRRTYGLLSSLVPLLDRVRGRTGGALVTRERRTYRVELGGYRITVSHDYTLGWSPRARDEDWPACGCLIAELGDETFLVAGTGVVLTFETDGAEAGIDVVEQGVFEQQEWKAERRLGGDETHQGRHVRVPQGQWAAQRFSLYRFN
jgi:beta-galactosidase GanA